MTKKVITPASGSAQTIYYENSDDNTVVKFSAGGRTVTSHSKTDSFGRKVFDELQLGTDFVSRQFVYHAGKVTPEHKTNAKVKSSATTQLVSQIILSNGTTLSYGYDAEERITSVVETYTVDETPVTNTTLYTYDALGQLLTETVNGNVVNSMEYDNYGNIAKKNGKAYTYGNSTWKDLLTSYDGQSITYDKQGNPLTYRGHALSWEKGRQLKVFDSNTYTYNANGIRTGKTVNDVTHTYTLDGTKILRETWDGNTLIPLYDNEDSVCGIVYNDIPYYFIKNLQGDVIAIVDKDAQTVAKYSYDAWGVCTVTPGSASIATVNPFRYRGYYYDEEIELYYLQSRYYDANVGRFITTDDERMIFYNKDALTLSFFNYCLNCPVNYVDASGKLAITISLSAAAAAALLKALIALLIACVAIAILSDPGFQRALANAIDSMGTGIKSLSDAVVKAIDNALDKAKKKKKDNRYERHHIVAQSSTNSDAIKSRQLINRVGIGVNSSHNLVDIKYNLHRHLHTSAYYKAVYKFLKRAEGSYAKTVLVLNVIKKALQAASNACP